MFIKPRIILTTKSNVTQYGHLITLPRTVQVQESPKVVLIPSHGCSDMLTLIPIEVQCINHCLQVSI